MARFFCSDLPHWWRKSCRCFLAFFWVTGLACGILVHLTAGSLLVPLMRSAACAPVSIFGLLCVSVLPFLLSAFVVFLSKPVLLLPICFGKAFLFSFVSLGIYQAFGSAGWIFRWLLLFNDCACVPLLYWFWLRYLSGDRPLYCWEAALILSLEMLIGSVNYNIISPFLARLIEI